MIFSGMHFFLKKLRTFLVVTLNAHAKTAKLTTPSPQPCPAQQKKLLLPQRLGVHLPLTPINYAKYIFSPCTPWLYTPVVMFKVAYV